MYSYNDHHMLLRNRLEQDVGTELFVMLTMRETSDHNIIELNTLLEQQYQKMKDNQTAYLPDEGMGKRFVGKFDLEALGLTPSQRRQVEERRLYKALLRPPFSHLQEWLSKEQSPINRDTQMVPLYTAEEIRVSSKAISDLNLADVMADHSAAGANTIQPFKRAVLLALLPERTNNPQVQAAFKRVLIHLCATADAGHASFSAIPAHIVEEMQMSPNAVNHASTMPAAQSELAPKSFHVRQIEDSTVTATLTQKGR